MSVSQLASPNRTSGRKSKARNTTGSLDESPLPVSCFLSSSLSFLSYSFSFLEILVFIWFRCFFVSSSDTPTQKVELKRATSHTPNDNPKDESEPPKKKQKRA
jgi:hypothetical protein